LKYILPILKIQKQSFFALSKMATQVQPIYLISVNNTSEVVKKLVAELIYVSTLFEKSVLCGELIVYGVKGDKRDV